jgi:hypothetical protein
LKWLPGFASQLIPFGGGPKMCCMLCHSPNQREFPSEINIHFSGVKNLEKPTVWAFPALVVCLNCGLTKFVLDGDELVRLREGNSAASPETQSV